MVDLEEILVVEDQQPNLEFLTDLLSKAGYRPRPARSGELALRSVHAKLPALILLDIRMPEMDGFEVCRRLKEDEKTRTVPVIFISAVIEEQEKVRGLQLGALDYITKPFQTEEVLARINMHLARLRAENEIRRLNQELERRVEERTEALREANRHLEDKIGELEQAQQALQQSETRYRIVADNTFDWEYWLDQQGRFIYSSPSCERITGFEPADFFRDADLLERMVFPEDMPVFKRHKDDVRQKHEPGEIEFRIRRRDGEVCWIGHVCQPVFDDTGGYLGNRGSNRDISAHRQADGDLRESEARYRALFENMAQGVFYQRADGVLEDVNEAALQMLGVSRDQFLGRTSYDPSWRVVREDGSDLPPEEHASMKALRSGLPVRGMRMGVYNPSKKGITWLNANATPEFRTGEKKPFRVAVTLHDFSARKQAEEALRQSEARFRQFFTGLPEAAYMVSPAGLILDANEAALHMLGYEREDLHNMPLANIYAPESLPKMKLLLEQWKMSGQVRGEEMQVVRKDGERRTVLLYAGAVRDENNNILHSTSVQMDITGRINMEKALIEAEKLASVGTLAAGIAHEINTPLQVVTGISEGIVKRLKEGQELTGETLMHRMDVLNNSAWRIAAIVRSLREYTRGSPEELKLCSLNEIVESTLMLVEHQFKTGAEIIISRKLGEGLPALNCDPGRITQVLINLLNNARDAMPAGGQVMIETGFDTAAGELVLRVGDTGCGIPEEIRGRIFDPFFTTRPPGQGTGLGLSAAAGILRAHNGRLELESSTEKGSVFKISLPLAADPPPENAGQGGRY